ncbi:MAG: hypothetical protein MJ151_00380 [Lachnospiraceae bacterium]|nr:hypothetical protein [Lachnospiraceae bacterium]
MFSFLHKIDFYISLVKGIECTQNYGFFPMYINPVANGGMGSFAPIAMPHLILYIPAIIYHYVRDINVAFNIFFVVLNVLQCFFMYLALQELTKKKMESIIASLLYTSFYLLVLNTPFRAGLSECIAITFIPLVVYGFSNIYFNDSKYRIALLIGLFCIAESNVTIFALTLSVMLLFCVLFLLKSIFRMKILRIIFVLIPLVLLITFTYVPMVHYYMLKQYSIVDVVGDMRVIISSFVVAIIPFIYILISKSIIKKTESEIIRAVFNVIILLVFTCSLFIYTSFYNTEKMTIKDNIECIDTVYVPKVASDYYEKNNEYLKKLYDKCGMTMYDIRVNDFNQSYLFMNIDYETSPYYERCVLDIPYYNAIGFRAYDKDNKPLPLTYGMDNQCRVVVNRGKGLIKIGFRPPIMWNIALLVSIFGVFWLIIWRIIVEIRTYKKLLKIDKKEKEKEKDKKLALENTSDI